MNKQFEINTAGNGKYSREYKKFPRKKINGSDDEISKLSMRKTHNNYGQNIYTSGDKHPFLSWNHVNRFVQSHIGEDVDKVYSDFCMKLDLSSLRGKEDVLNDTWKRVIYIPNSSELIVKEMATFTVDENNMIIKNPDKNKNIYAGKW